MEKLTVVQFSKAFSRLLDGDGHVFHPAFIAGSIDTYSKDPDKWILEHEHLYARLIEALKD